MTDSRTVTQVGEQERLHVVDRSGRVYPEGVPGTDADPVSIFRGGGVGRRSGLNFGPSTSLGLRLQTAFRGSACLTPHITRPGDAPEEKHISRGQPRPQRTKRFLGTPCPQAV